MRTRQKRRILPDTMIQEIGRSVKCQKLNKFISRTPKLSVNKPKARRGDQFPGDPRWLSGQAGIFFPLTVLPRRNLTPRQTRPLPGNARELLPAGAGGSVPWRPPMAERACGHLLPSHSSAPEESHAPAIPTLLPGIAKELLPAGALRSNVAGTCGSPTNAPSKNAVQGFVIGSVCAAAFFIGGLSPS